MITDPSAILFICTSLRESVLFFLLKEAHFMLARSFLAARCAIRGQCEADGHRFISEKSIPSSPHESKRDGKEVLCYSMRIMCYIPDTPCFLSRISCLGQTTSMATTGSFENGRAT